MVRMRWIIGSQFTSQPGGSAKKQPGCSGESREQPGCLHAGNPVAYDDDVKAFYSDHFVLPLPDGHKFPMAKYSRLRERVIAEGLVAAADLHEAPAAAWADLEIVHTPEYVQAVANGTLPREIQRRIG